MSIREDIISKVIKETGASSFEAERALNIANQNIETAILLINTKIIIVSGKIIAEYEDIFGLFLIKFFLNNNFVRPFFCFSRDYEITKFNVNQNWYNIENFINDNCALYTHDKFLNDFNSKMRDKIINSENLKKILNDSSQVLTLAESIEKIIYNEIFPEFFNARLFIDMSKIVLSQAQYEWEVEQKVKTAFVNFDGRDALTEPLKISSKTQETEEQAPEIFVKTEPVICDNLKKQNDFKKASELAVGEDILVKIIATNPQSAYIYNMLKLDTNRMTHNNVNVKIINIDKSDKDMRVFIVELIPGIFSKLKIPPDILIKINHKLTYSFKSSIIIMIILFVCVFIVAVYFILYLKK